MFALIATYTAYGIAARYQMAGFNVWRATGALREIFPTALLRKQS